MARTERERPRAGAAPEAGLTRPDRGRRDNEKAVEAVCFCQKA
jgi:hypothetical protein